MAYKRRRKRRYRLTSRAKLLVLALVIVIIAGVCFSQCSPRNPDNSPSPTLTPQATQTAVPTLTPTYTQTPTPAPTPTPQPTPTPTQPPLSASGVVTAEMKAAIGEFMDVTFQAMAELSSKDVTYLFAENAYDKAKLNQTAIEVLVMLRKASVNDLSLLGYSWELIYGGYTYADGVVTINAKENNMMKFAVMKGAESKSYDLAHTFQLIWEDGRYKLLDHVATEGYYTMVSSAFAATELVDPSKSEIDVAFGEILFKLKSSIDTLSLQQKIKYNDYIEKRLPTITKTADHAYDRATAAAYAKQWITSRNPEWLKYDDWGGNCQNFGSQCLIAGGIPMDHNGTSQWKHYSGTVNTKQEPVGRSTSWTGVVQFYNYARTNTGYGLVAVVDYNIFAAEEGDILQVGSGGSYSHTVIVSDLIRDENGNVVEVVTSSNTANRENFPMTAYNCTNIRLIKILGWNDG